MQQKLSEDQVRARIYELGLTGSVRLLWDYPIKVAFFDGDHQQKEWIELKQSFPGTGLKFETDPKNG